MAACFTDHRGAEAVKHTLPDLLRQRIFALALGYEDLIDHDALRFALALAAVIDKPGGALAGKSTLNQLQHAAKIGQNRQKFGTAPFFRRSPARPSAVES